MIFYSLHIFEVCPFLSISFKHYLSFKLPLFLGQQHWLLIGLPPTILNLLEYIILVVIHPLLP